MSRTFLKLQLQKLYSDPERDCCNYLRQDGDSEGLVTDFAHQVEGDDWEDVPGRGASLPAYQLLPEPEPRGKLLGLKNQGWKDISWFS